MDKGISASSRSHPLTNMQTDLSAACFSDNQREVLGEFASSAIGTHATQDEKSDGLENAGRVPCPSLLQIRQEFSHCFIRQGFKEEPAARLASGVDPTVLFVGSNISTLKKYILDRIPCEGVVVVQPSLRFRELKMLFNSSYKPLYGAYFDEMGAITPHTNPERLTDLLLEYLTGSLGLTQGDLVARVSRGIRIC